VKSGMDDPNGNDEWWERQGDSRRPRV